MSGEEASSTHRKHRHSMSALHSLSEAQLVTLAGAASGFFAGVVVCPLDVVKTRLQAQGAIIWILKDLRIPQGSVKYKGFRGAFKTILKEEGIRGLYRGLVPITIGYLPTWMIYFSIYERAKTFYPRVLDRYGLYMPAISHCALAITAGMVLSIAVNPIWVVKTRLMVQTGKNKTVFDTKDLYAKRTYYKGTLDAFRTIYKEEGIRAFYRGLVPSLFGLVHVGIHFPVYEKLKQIFHCDGNQSGVLGRLIMALSFSKMIALTITYPHEIVRTRMQIQPARDRKRQARLVESVIKIYRKEGMRGFYAGYAINMARTVPLSAVTLVSFEYIKGYLMRKKFD